MRSSWQRSLIGTAGAFPRLAARLAPTRRNAAGTGVRRLLLASLVVACVSLASPVGAASTRYSIALHVDWTNRSFWGLEEIDWTNPGNVALNDVLLRLYPNAPSLYGNGALDVFGVRVNGEEAETDLSLGNTVLRVHLPLPLPGGSAVSLALLFAGRPAFWDETGPERSAIGYGTFAASPRTVTLASFYPILATQNAGEWDLSPVEDIGDPVTSDAATYALSVTADCHLTVLASGTREGQETATDGCATRFTGEGMRDVMVVLGDGYQEELQTASGVLLVASFFPEHDAARGIALARASAAVSIYGESFGPYAYDELALVEVPLNRAAGVEYPGLVLLAESYCANPQDPFFDVIVAHEVAHQWWYAAVGNDVVREPWLDEGLATFSSGVFLEQAMGEDVARGAIATWQRTYTEAKERHPELSVASPTSSFQDTATYSAFVYCGGALFFDALRRDLGDLLFFDVLRGYYREESFQIAHASDLLHRFVDASPRDLSDLFVEYLGGQAAGPALSCGR